MSIRFHISVVTTLDELVRSHERITPGAPDVERTVNSLPLSADETAMVAATCTFLRRMHSRDGRPYC